MTSQDAPEFDDLDPTGPASGDASLSDESVPADPPKRPEGEAAGTDLTKPDGGPRRRLARTMAHSTVAHNGHNGHGRPGGTVGFQTNHTPPGPPTQPPSSSPADSLLQVLARAAASAFDGEEAALLAAAMVPVALEGASHGSALQPTILVLIRYTAELARWLVDMGARDLVQRIPLILRETARVLGHVTAQGRPLSRRLVSDVMAEEAAKAINRHPHAARPWQLNEMDGDDDDR